MKFGNDLMSSEKTQYEKIGNFAKRSDRNVWAEKQEQLVRELSPYPISYDVNQGQSSNFSEYTYTEFLGGLWICSQSLEINCRIFEDASNYTQSREITDLSSIVADKYNMIEEDLGRPIKRVCFLPGHNRLDVCSTEITSRLAFEEEDIWFKPHPITNDEAMRMIGARIGWNRIIPREVSGNMILRNCEELFTTSASEMAISGTILGKKVVNVSNFFNEGSGAYYPISKILFKKHKESVKAAQEALLNIINCPWSGIILPLHSDPEDRIRQHYETSLKYRKAFKPLAGPKGSPPAKNSKV